VLAKLYTESNTRCILAFTSLLDSRGEPALNATDFFVETRVVVCDAETGLNSPPAALLLLRNKRKREKY
jgi:hypothetical protein